MSHSWLTNHGTTTCESFGLDPVTARDTQSLTLLGLLGGGHQSAHLNGSWEGGGVEAAKDRCDPPPGREGLRGERLSPDDTV